MSTPTARAQFQAPRPLTDLARDTRDPVVVDGNYQLGRGMNNLIIWLVVLTLIFWGLFYWFKPAIVQSRGIDGRLTGTANVGRSLLAGFLIALLITLLIWVFRSRGNVYGYNMSSGPANILLWFVILGLVFWGLLYWLNPTVVQTVAADGTPTGSADVVKALLGGVIIALIITLLIWLFRACQ